MGRSLSNAKIISAIVVDTISVAVGRRGYAGASQGGLSSGTARGGGGILLRKGVVEDSRKNSPWVPDPVTGYYRPENHAKDIDAAQLREMFLKQEIPRQ